MSGVYHIITEKPKLNKWDMPPRLEELADRLINSGLLRVDTGLERNFVRVYRPYQNISLTFSKKQLFDENLSEMVVQKLTWYFTRTMIAQDAKYQAKKELEKLRKEYKTINVPVNPIVEKKIARMLVQATEPIVMLTALYEGIELFASFSGSIGDVMDIPTWRTSGDNGGMQSSNGVEAAVFVSCGGNPFRKVSKEDAVLEYGDGPPALARFMIIVAQELGHYSDIIRNRRGYHADRHSANFSGTRPKPEVEKARMQDLYFIRTLHSQLNKAGLDKLVEFERRLEFFRKRKLRGIVFLFTLRRRNIYLRKIINYAQSNNLDFINYLTPKKELGTMIDICLKDMVYNLEPLHEAYKRENLDAEKAIACIEALARIPQQSIKWGHNICKFLSPDLYNIYYDQVIPSCFEQYKMLTGVEVKNDFKTPPSKLNMLIGYLIWKLFKRERSS